MKPAILSSRGSMCDLTVRARGAQDWEGVVRFGMQALEMAVKLKHTRIRCKAAYLNGARTAQPHAIPLAACALSRARDVCQSSILPRIGVPPGV
eukprot:1213161-Rhodomonas_salina.3